MSISAPASPPPVPRPAGVVDLAQYRGRVGVGPAVAPPPRDEDEGAEPSVMAPALLATVERATPAARPPAVVPERPLVEQRVIRRLRLRSVAKLAFGSSLCGVAVVIGAGVVTWLVASTLGVVDNLESLAEDLGWDRFELDGPGMLRAATTAGGILVVAATFLATIAAEVFNLLSTITGGLRAEVGPPPATRRERRLARRAENAVREDD